MLWEPVRSLLSPDGVSTWNEEERMESSRRRSSIQIYWCCSLDSVVEVSKTLKLSRAGDIKLIMPRGITEFPFKLFPLSQTPNSLKLVLILNPHFSLSSSPSWLVFSFTAASDGFPVQPLLHFGLVARWLCYCQDQTVRGQSSRETAQVFWIGEPGLFNENIAREKRLRGNIFPKRNQRGESHNGALTLQRPILVFEATSLLCDWCV